MQYLKPALFVILGIAVGVAAASYIAKKNAATS